MTRNRLVIAGIALSLAALVVAAVVINHSPETTEKTDVTTNAAAKAQGTRKGLAQSSDKVSLTVADASGSDALASDEIVVTLNIDSGWHVNANPATLEFLIPTAASATANGRSLDIPAQYPPGRVSDITLGETAIEVYDDGASIRLLPDEENAAKLKEAGELNLKVRVQACNDSGVCLAPSDLSLTLGPAGAGTP
ncbi:MAG: hypothetical protein CMH11_00865 [Maritimibacter sp.]|nr:hypothetical protein [Maritimibacter sp.]|tara:strand:+ start:2102 stop:2686 length:585 start_codon:yes stop_codon:yes gene_type:complete